MAEPAIGASAPLPASSPAPQGQWPHQLGQKPSLKVGDVLGALVNEFPSLTLSKLRFLDAQGLVSPGRTPSGYRQYSQAQVERTRYVLRQQRDAYAPLGVIRDRLALLDCGEAFEPVAMTSAPRGSSIDIEALCAATGAAPSVVAELVSARWITPLSEGLYDSSVLPLVAASARYVASGADVRELLQLGRAVTREAESAWVAAAPLKRPDDREIARAAFEERLDAAAALFGAFAKSSPPEGS